MWRRIARCCIAVSVALVLPAEGGGLTSEQRATLSLGTYPPGMQAPALDGRTLDGRTVSLGELRGRVVLLNFWASWCLECRPEMPAFERLHRSLAASGLTVLGINVRESEPTVRRYAGELRLTFPIVLDTDGVIGRRYGVLGLPTTFLIGRDGSAVALAIGPREWGSAAAEAIIRSLLAARPGRSETP